MLYIRSAPEMCALVALIVVIAIVCIAVYVWKKHSGRDHYLVYPYLSPMDSARGSYYSIAESPPAWREEKEYFCAGCNEGGFCGSGNRPVPDVPGNMQLYDSPYMMPSYFGLNTLNFDPDKRCRAFCSSWPCSVSCR